MAKKKKGKKPGAKGPTKAKSLRPDKKKARARVARARSRRSALAPAAAAFGAADLVNVDLSKTANSPPLVRVTTPGNPNAIIPPLASSGSIAGVAVGSFITIRIEVVG